MAFVYPRPGAVSRANDSESTGRADEFRSATWAERIRGKFRMFRGPRRLRQSQMSK
jgi:hypothetical protein